MLITLEEARAQLNLGESETDDDALIGGYIAGVAAHLESQYGIVVDRAEREWIFDRFGPVMILRATSIEIDSVAVTYLDSAGAEQVLEGVRVIPTRKHYRLAPVIGSEWPIAASGPGVITVTAQAGYVSDAETSEGVPSDIKVIGKMMVAHWYLNREAVGRDMGEVPLSVAALLEPYDPLSV